MSKVTIRGVDPKLWREAKHDSIDQKKSMGEIVNEGLALRQSAKSKRAKK